jgi:hypothetical protein
MILYDLYDIERKDPIKKEAELALYITRKRFEHPHLLKFCEKVIGDENSGIFGKYTSIFNGDVNKMLIFMLVAKELGFISLGSLAAYKLYKCSKSNKSTKITKKQSKRHSKRRSKRHSK